MARSQASPLSFKDYQRTFRVLMSVVAGMREEGIGRDPGRSCVFFSYAGALILNKHYGIQSVPVAGGALIRIDSEEPGMVISFGQREGKNVASSRTAFHTWIVCANMWLIDFLAPIFQEAIKASHQVPRRMFQKRLSDAAPSPDHLAKAGDFFLMPNLDLSRDIYKSFRTPAFNDLANVCLSWHRPFGEPIEPTLAIASDDGREFTLELSKMLLDGCW